MTLFQYLMEGERRLSSMGYMNGSIPGFRPGTPVDDYFGTLERFVVGEDKVDTCRQYCFTSKGRQLGGIPQTHTKRATYQAGHMWGQSLICAFNPYK